MKHININFIETLIVEPTRNDGTYEIAYCGKYVCSGLYAILQLSFSENSDISYSRCHS